ncbi:hypothetical protein [Halomonas denitrificans]|uniref:hypothetical protein n=1 Tax=Halomonas denitrificans TaxID=370769 RepID=UPI001B879EBA|nr:hypothetical protein [Halomonas denitrificans]
MLVERWILARLRHHIFFTLASLNQAIRELLEDLNRSARRASSASSCPSPPRPSTGSASESLP